MPREILHRATWRVTPVGMAGLVVLAGFVIYRAWSVLLPFALIALVILALARLLIGLHRRGSGPASAVALVVLATLASFTTLAVVLCRDVVHLSRTLPEKVEQIRAGMGN
jgi:predicted PurR-regulated permease PerM